MIPAKKYATITILIIFLTIPIIFGIYIEFFNVKELNFSIILFILFGLFTLIVIGKLIVLYCYDNKTIEIMKKHDVIDAFINKDNNSVLWIFFPLTMIMEEFVFRYYLIGFFSIHLKFDAFLAVFLSSLIFSIYHIHFWFTLKNVRIVLIYITYSFLLGLLNGFVLLTLGIIPCIIIHYSLAFYMYYSIYRRYYRKKKLLF